MICCLPSTPGNAWVIRIDSMISLSLRSAVRCGSWTRAGSSSVLRTSCWVIVEAPRLSPRNEPIAAETMATGSNPALSQKVLSSTAVVASSRTLGISSNWTTSRLASPKRASSILPGAVVDDRLLREDVGRQLRRRGEVRVDRVEHGDRGERRDGAEAGQEDEDDDGDPADRGRAGARGGSSGRHGGGRTP